jgi:prephenate dehydrogenase
MAGSERDGFDAARADLFGGAVCVVTPGAESDPSTVNRVEGFWAALGCRVRRLEPDRHDEVVAAISHLPHVVAAALVEVVGTTDPQALDFCGPGFRDTTRVAGGPSSMWTEILRENRAPVRKSVEAMIEKLREVVILLDDSDEVAMKRFLNEAKARREALRAGK